MTVNCNHCGRPIKDGDEVTFLGQGYYKQLKSRVIGAITAESFDLDPETLCHIDCLGDTDDAAE